MSRPRHPSGRRDVLLMTPERAQLFEGLSSVACVTGSLLVATGTSLIAQFVQAVDSMLVPEFVSCSAVLASSRLIHPVRGAYGSAKFFSENLSLKSARLECAHGAPLSGEKTT